MPISIENESVVLLCECTQMTSDDDLAVFDCEHSATLSIDGLDLGHDVNADDNGEVASLPLSILNAHDIDADAPISTEVAFLFILGLALIDGGTARGRPFYGVPLVYAIVDSVCS